MRGTDSTTIPPAPQPYGFEWMTGAGGVPGTGTSWTGPGARSPSASPPPARPPFPPVPREWTLLAGVGGARLFGVAAAGGRIRFAFSSERLAAVPRAVPIVSVELFAGETRPGLPVRSLTLAAELWTAPEHRVRAGGGLGFGLVVYQRATTSEWPAVLTTGLHAGIEATVVRFRSTDVVVGAHGNAHLESWVSGGISVGVRGRPARAASPLPPPAFADPQPAG